MAKAVMSAPAAGFLKSVVDSGNDPGLTWGEGAAYNVPLIIRGSASPNSSR
jgi:hypothetical protein